MITLRRDRFSKFVERKLSVGDMAEWLPWLGVDIEETGEEHVKVEFNPNRIDFCSYVGVARAFVGLRGWKTGLPKYEVKDGETVLEIDRAVSKIRPFMLAAVVRDIELEEEDVADLMEIQEDLHWGIGRNRAKASIGVHNLDVVKPPFKFTAVEPYTVTFVPLDATTRMSLKEVLEEHEKGVAYRHLIDWASKYPILVDRDSAVLSMPPIINGELTRIDENSENLFLDVTGTDYTAVEKSLNVLSTALADMGGTVEKVKVKYANRTVSTPNLKAQKMKLRQAYVNKLLGLKLSTPTIIECLKKCRLGANVQSDGKTIEAAIPAYRIDILHEVDLVEEVAIGYGYYKLEPTFPTTVTVGKQHPTLRIANLIRQIMIGLGYIEVVNFTLTNEELQYRNMRRTPGKPARLSNPVSTEYTIIRQCLLPSLVKNLADNKHESFPQKLFEVSDVVTLNRRLETGCKRRLHLAAVSSHAKANFTEIKSTVEALLATMGLKRWKTVEAKNPSFIDGRAANVTLNERYLCTLGELHPEVLNNFELENPTTAFEVDLEALVT